MEKTISIRNTEITFSVRPHHVFPLSIGHPQTDRGLLLRLERVGQIWDLGGQREFVSMLPLVSNDAVAILFMFDLTRKSTLNSIKEWYRQARGFNNVRPPPPPFLLPIPSVARLTIAFPLWFRRRPFRYS